MTVGLIEDTKVNKVMLNGIVGSDITVESIKDLAEVDELIINSPGGSLYEGWRIYDTIKLSGKKITTGVIGICASSAIQVLLAGSYRWGSENSRYLIHRTSDMAIGNANDFQKTAEELAIEDSILAKKYSEISGKSFEEVMARMKTETLMTATEALDWNIINEIKTISNMELKEINDKISYLDKTILTISNFIFGKKNLIVQDVNGIELDFGESVKSVEEIQPGYEVTINGNAANGEFVMPDGTKYKCENGKVMEIEAPNPEMPMAEEITALKADIANKELEITNLRNELLTVQCTFDSYKNESKTQIENLMRDYTNFKKQFNPETPIIDKPEVEKKPISNRVKNL